MERAASEQDGWSRISDRSCQSHSVEMAQIHVPCLKHQSDQNDTLDDVNKLFHGEYG